MTVFRGLRNRLRGREALARPKTGGDPRPPDDPVAGAQAPFAGYDRLDAREVMDGLCEHSQIELEAVESYERGHEGREPVLDKLRFMRGREPLPGYDAFSVGEVTAALEEADMATIKKVRDYERKFARRPEVMEEAVRVHRLRQQTEPKSAVPGYQPLGGAIDSSAPVGTPGGRDPD